MIQFDPTGTNRPKDYLSLIMFTAAVSILLLFISSCHKRVPVDRPFQAHPTWSAVSQPPSADCPKDRCESFLVWVYSGGSGLKDSSDELCGHKNAYVCIGPDPAGQVVMINRRRR